MAIGVEGAVISGGVRVALALARRRAEPQFGASVDAAIGDPGMKVHLHNRSASPVHVRAWGILARRELPRLARLPALIRPEFEALSLRALHARSCALQGAEADIALEPGGSQHLWVRDAPHPSGKVAPLCGWVDLAAHGLLISRPKSSGWSRSDIGPVVCDCGHHEVLHGVRASRLRIGMRSWEGACTVEGCRCRRKRTRRHLTIESVPDCLPPGVR